MSKARRLTSRDLARTIAQAAYDVKAEDLCVLDLRKVSQFADFFVIASGRSDRQVQAICDNINEDLSKKKMKPLGVEGYAKGHWILMDFGSVIVHIFYEETRVFYGLERLWGDAPRLRFRLK